MSTPAAKPAAAKPKAAKKPKVAPKHPPYLEMVKEAIKATAKPVKGSSRTSIAKYLEAKYGKVLGGKFKATLRLALKKAAASGVLVQTKGSFRLSKTAKKPKVKKPQKAKKVKKAKKPKAKKVKKPKAKKAKKPKKPKAKKAAKPKKASKAKVAKKAAKPKVAKKAAKAPKPRKASTKKGKTAAAPAAEAKAE